MENRKCQFSASTFRHLPEVVREGASIVDRHGEFLTRFLKHQAEVRAFVGSVVRDREAREDVFQEVALVLWQEYEKYDSSRSFGAWARGIAANKIRQRWERSGRWPAALSSEALQAVAEAYDRTEATRTAHADALQHCVGQLPEKSRRLLALRYEQALKLHQMSELLETTTDAVHKALSRIRDKLWECVQRRLSSTSHGTGN
jgi:RNA polymerase sigma-70 factor (ECF subfamily)